MKKLALIIILIALTMACGNKDKGSAKPVEKLDGRYTVSAIEGIALEEGVEIWLNFDPVESRVNGKAACNTFFGSFTQEGESIQLRQMGSTMMACPDPLMEYEGRFLKLLGESATVAVKGDSLMMKSEGENILIAATKSKETE